MRRRSKLVERLARALIAASALAPLPIVAGSCSGTSTEASVRSLERTGRVAFVCLGKPGSSAALHPMSDCSRDVLETPSDFGTDAGATHVYAVVTLETRGEVAVVDLSSTTGNVLDQDISTPGANPLPVGAQPTDIVATPKGTAVFVASAESLRPALYAIGAEALRPCAVDPDVTTDDCNNPPPTLSSWPACKLPSAPGQMVMLADPPAAEGGVRDTCDGGLKPVDDTGPDFADIDQEGLGRQKLYVTLPSEGRVVVVDAQELFSRAPGELDDCIIEREVDLTSTVPVPPEPPAIPDGPACVVPEAPKPRPSGPFNRAIPAGLALDAPVGGSPGNTGATLYVADIGAPLIHVLDLADPCAPVEKAPLLPTSVEDPTRVVVSDRVAVSGLTPSQHRYLYATDVEDTSVMAFDLSDGSAEKTPIQVPNPELNPFQPADRVRFASSPVDLTILQRDLPQVNGLGVAPFGTLCDPDPHASVCNADSTSCDLGTIYRPSSDFATGAGPFTLRGDFALVALASGQIAVIDIEDFDAPCRGPVDQDASLGCNGTGAGLITTAEPSCNVVAPNTPRSGFYLLTNDDVGRHMPGVQTFPVLSLEDGTVVTNGPAMRVPDSPTPSLFLAVGGDIDPIDPNIGGFLDENGARNTLLLNFQNPRVHQTDQAWSAVFEGALPGFSGHVGDLSLSNHTFSDSTVAFCDRGVQSENAVREELETQGVSGSDLDTQAALFADRLHVAEPLAPIDDVYWQTASCSFSDCRSTFGEAEVPTVQRDVRILEASRDQLELAPTQGTTEEFFECCFPTLVDYEIRPGNQWVLIGGASGFTHNVIADPETGVCRPTCDPRFEKEVGRIRHSIVADPNTPIASDDPHVFDNALFRFVINVPADAKLQRDMAFRWLTQASFTPLRAALTDDTRTSVQVQTMRYLPATDEIVTTDGALEGLILVPGDLVGDVRQFF